MGRIINYGYLIGENQRQEGQAYCNVHVSVRPAMEKRRLHILDSNAVQKSIGKHPNYELINPTWISLLQADHRQVFRSPFVSSGPVASEFL